MLNSTQKQTTSQRLVPATCVHSLMQNCSTQQHDTWYGLQYKLHKVCIETYSMAAAGFLSCWERTYIPVSNDLKVPYHFPAFPVNSSPACVHLLQIH